MSKPNGSLIRIRRIEKGLTESELASGICTPSMIVQIEEGKARPSEELLNRIAGKLGVPAAALVGEVNH